MNTILKIASLLKAKGKTVTSVESCTGGLIGHLLTNVPGSSEWYIGGAVVYSNILKHSLLGVRRETLDRHGAVSAEVAEQMARGGRQAFDTDYAISVTGIAGPDGGSEEKPVGLTYIGVATPERVVVRRFVWEGSREGNKRSSADAAFELLLELMQEEQTVQQPDSEPASAAVEAAFELDGTIRPQSFIWKGRTQRITDYGRSWQEAGVRHFLVMTLDNRVWELRFKGAALRLTIHPKSEMRYTV